MCRDLDCSGRDVTVRLIPTVVQTLAPGGLSFAGSQHDTLTLSFMCSKVKLVVILFDRWLSLTAFKLSHIGQKQESL